MHHHLQHSKSTGQLVELCLNNNQNASSANIVVADENANPHPKVSKSNSKFGLLIRTPRRRRANCLSQFQQPPESVADPSAPTVNRTRSKSWEAGKSSSTDRPGKSTWSGWRSLRKISDTLIDYALNEPYKADSLFDDELVGAGSGSVYRRRSELSDAVSVNHSSSASAVAAAHQRSKTVGHAQGVSESHSQTRSVVASGRADVR